MLDHRGAVHPPLFGAVLGDVGDPQPVRGVSGELTLDQVLEHRRGAVSVAPPAPVDPLQAVQAHQPLDPLPAASELPAQGELGVHPSHPVGAAGGAVDVDDRVEQVGVGQVPPRGRAGLSQS